MLGAIALGVALGSCDTDDRPSEAQPSRSNPIPTPAPAATAVLSPFADLPPGEPPTVGYVAHYVHIAPDGTRTALPRGRGISAIAPYLDGFVISDAVYFEGTNGFAILRHGRVERVQPCTSGAAAVSQDGSTVAWATFACPESGVPAPTLIHRRSPHGEDVQQVDVAPNTNVLTSVVGLLDDALFYNRGFGEGAFLTDPVEGARQIPGLRSASTIDESRGMVAGQLGRFGVVVEPITGHVQWKLRGARLSAFSPRGTSIVASSGRAAWVLDARTGLVRYSLRVPDLVVLSTFHWEDEHHLLAVASGRRETAIMRFDASGQAELAAPAIRSQVWHAGYVLESQP